MGTIKQEPLFYIIIRDVKTRPNYKTKTITVYKNGVPTKLEHFKAWLKNTIERRILMENDYKDY